MNKTKFQEGETISGTVVIIYAAVTNTDLTEGRGQRVDHSYYRNRRDATIGASGIGVMGSQGNVEPRTALRITDNQYLLLSDPVKVSENPKKVAELRKQAFAKLTEAERAALLGE